MITKKYKDEIFAWDPTAFNGKGYWYVLGTKGGLGRAASKKEAKFLGKPLEKIADIEVDKDLTDESKEIEQPEEKEEQEEEKYSPRQMKRMKYERARVIRRTGLSDVISSRLVSGQGVTRSVAGAVGDKISARLTGIKQSMDLVEKLDPLNIAKFLTGGSSLGPALLGRLLGRKQEDIEYYSGFGGRGGRRRKLGTASLISSALTGKKITPLPQDNGVSEAANQLYGLFSEYFEHRKKEQERKKAFEEEIKNEDNKKHQEIIDALTSLGAKKPTATKVKPQDKQTSIIDTVANMFGLGVNALNILKTIGIFFTGPVGLAILGVATLAGLAYLIFSNQTKEGGERTAEGLGNTLDLETGGKAIMEASTDVVAMRKARILRKASEDGKFKTSVFNFSGRAKEEKQYLNLIGFDEKTGLTKAEIEKGFNAVDEDGNPYVIPSKAKAQTTENVPKTENVTNPPSVPKPEVDTTVKEKQSAIPVPAQSDIFNRIEAAMSESMNMQMADIDMNQMPTILNNVAAAATAEKTQTGVTGSNPVRNDDDSLIRAMTQSYRTV